MAADFVSYAPQLLEDVEQAVWRSMDDVLEDAQRRSGSNKLTASSEVVRIGELEGQVLFNAPFAKARERGAYIQPRQRRALRFAGRFSMHARLRKHPYLKPAGDRWGEHLRRRLGEVGR